MAYFLVQAGRHVQVSSTSGAIATQPLWAPTGWPMVGKALSQPNSEVRVPEDAGMGVLVPTSREASILICIPFR